MTVKYHLGNFYIIVVMLQKSLLNEDGSYDHHILTVFTSHNQILLLVCAFNSELEFGWLLDFCVVKAYSVVVSGIASFLYFDLH